MIGPCPDHSVELDFVNIELAPVVVFFTTMFPVRLGATEKFRLKANPAVIS